MLFRGPLQHFTVRQLVLQRRPVHHHLDPDHRVLEALVLFLVGTVVHHYDLVVLVVVKEERTHLERKLELK